MKKFCCDGFRFHYDAKNEMGLNFRIIKLSPDFVKRGFFGDNPCRYLISEGYEKLTDKTKTIVMEFCPYCGKELKKLYCSDEYVNETNHD
jgi:hypothetical protein